VDDLSDGKRVGPGVFALRALVATAGDVQKESHVPALAIQFPAVAAAAWTRFDSFSARWRCARCHSSSARPATTDRSTATSVDQVHGAPHGRRLGGATGGVARVGEGRPHASACIATVKM
jgi:hypothetical protein